MSSDFGNRVSRAFLLGPSANRRERTLRLLEEGFKAVKLRLRADTMAGDVAQVAAVRGAIGMALVSPKMEIMVDANQAGVSRLPGPEPARGRGVVRHQAHRNAMALAGA